MKESKQAVIRSDGFNAEWTEENSTSMWLCVFICSHRLIAVANLYDYNDLFNARKKKAC